MFAYYHVSPQIVIVKIIEHTFHIYINHKNLASTFILPSGRNEALLANVPKLRNILHKKTNKQKNNNLCGFYFQYGNARDICIAICLAKYFGIQQNAAYRNTNLHMLFYSSLNTHTHTPGTRRMLVLQHCLYLKGHWDSLVLQFSINVAY